MEKLPVFNTNKTHQEGMKILYAKVAIELCKKDCLPLNEELKVKAVFKDCEKYFVVAKDEDCFELIETDQATFEDIL